MVPMVATVAKPCASLRSATPSAVQEFGSPLRQYCSEAWFLSFAKYAKMPPTASPATPTPPRVKPTTFAVFDRAGGGAARSAAALGAASAGALGGAARSGGTTTRTVTGPGATV